MKTWGKRMVLVITACAAIVALVALTWHSKVRYISSGIYWERQTDDKQLPMSVGSMQHYVHVVTPVGLVLPVAVVTRCETEVGCGAPYITNKFGLACFLPDPSLNASASCYKPVEVIVCDTNEWPLVDYLMNDRMTIARRSGHYCFQWLTHSRIDCNEIARTATGSNNCGKPSQCGREQ